MRAKLSEVSLRARNRRRARLAGNQVASAHAFERLEERLVLQGVVIAWTGGGGNNTLFSNAANWQLNTVPGANDTAVFNTNATVTLNAATTVNVLDVKLGNVNINLMNQTLDASSVLEVNAQNAAGASLTISNGTVTTQQTWVNGGQGTGSLTVTGNTTSFTSTLNTEVANFSGIGELQIDGIATAHLGNLAVGMNGNGTVVIDSAKNADAQEISTGENANATGAIWIENGSTLAAANITLGTAGEGELNILQKSTVTSGAASLGNAPGGTGSVLVDASSWKISTDAAEALVVGDASNGDNESLPGGSLRIDDGGQVNVDGNTVVGFEDLAQNSQGSGDVVVDGQGSQLASKSLALGRAASSDGTLEVQNGGTVKVADLCDIGFAAEGSGTATIATGGKLTADSLYVGDMGTGTLNINQGGSVASSGLFLIGEGTDSDGYVYVSGGNSPVLLKVPQLQADRLTIADGGDGYMEVSEGGWVSVKNTVFIGDHAGSHGMLTVTGGNSYVGADDINVGDPGPGTLNIGAGAEVVADSVSIANGPNHVGTVNVYRLGTLSLTSQAGPAIVVGDPRGVPGGNSNPTALLNNNGTIVSKQGAQPMPAAGGTVTGNGVYLGNLVPAGPSATIVPGTAGSPYSSMTVDGLAAADGMTLDEQLGAAAENSSLTVDGTATLVEDAGGGYSGTLAISSDDSGDYASSTTFVVMWAEDGITGSLSIDDTDAPPPPGYEWALEKESGASGGIDLVLYLQPTLVLDWLAVSSGASGVTLTASVDLSGVSGGHVDFYEASAGGLISLGSVSTPSGGGYTLNTSVPYASGTSGAESFWAVAADSNDDPLSNWASAGDGSMQWYWTGSIGYSTDGSTLTGWDAAAYYGPDQNVTVGVGPLDDYNLGYGGPVAEVAFYSDTDGNPNDAALIGTDSTANADGNYLVTFSTAQYDPSTVYAVMNVVGGGQSVPYGDYAGAWYLSPDSPPYVSGLTPSSGENDDGSYTPGNALALSTGVVTLDGNNPTVQFYLDTSGSGQYIPGAATLLGSGTESDGTWNLSSVDTTEWVGPQTLFAVVTDDLGEQSVASLTMNSSAMPTIANLTSSSDRYTAGDEITLTATGVVTGDGVQQMAFYREGSGGAAPGGFALACAA